MTPEDVCADAENAFAARVLECTGDADLAQKRYDALKTGYGCVLARDEIGEASFACSASISRTPCESFERYGDDLGMLFSSQQQAACQGLFGAGGVPTDPVSACNTVFATARSAVKVCGWSESDLDAYESHLRQYLVCTTGFSADAYHVCLHAAEQLYCTSTSRLAADALASSCPGVLQKAEPDSCDQLRGEASSFLANSCAVGEAAADRAVMDVMGLLECRAPGTVSTLTCAGYFTCPAVDMQDLESVIRKALETTQCEEVFEPCSLLALKVEDQIFGCTGHESLAAEVGAAFRNAFQCDPSVGASTVRECSALLGCSPGQDVEAWLAAWREVNEQQAPHPECHHIVTDRPPGQPDAGAGEGGDW